jgi:CHAT domain-containing protein/tetratricopeptide (TPR) repeat protein
MIQFLRLAPAWLCGFACLYGTAAAQALPSTLMPGTAQSATLAPNERLAYQLDLAAGTTVELILREDDVHAPELRWQDEALVPLRVTAGRRAERSVTLLAERATHYAFEIAGRAKGQPVSYTLRLSAAQPISAERRARAAAQTALLGADDLRLRASAAEPASWARAEAAYREALAGWRVALDDCATAQTWSGLARLYLAHADYPAAERAARAGLALNCRNATTAAAVDRAELQRTLGSALAYQGDYTASIAAQVAALAVYRAVEDGRFEGVLLGNLSNAYAETGQTSRALDAAQAALKLAQASGDTAGVRFTQERVAAILLARGELGAAAEAFEAVLTALRETPDALVEGNAWNDLGLLYRELNEPDAALDAYRRAEAVARASGDAANLAETLRKQGEVALDTGALDTATDVLAQALTLSRDNNLQREQAQVLLGRGRLALARGALARADDDFQAAAAIADVEQARVVTIGIELARGDLASERQQRTVAGRHYRRALALAQWAQARNAQPLALASLARLEQGDGALPAARRHIEQALALIESQRSGIDDPGVRSGYFASRRAYYGLQIDILMQLERRQPGRGYAAAGWAASERARARALQDQLAERAIRYEGQIDASLRAAERAAEDQLHAAAYRRARIPSNAPAAQYAPAQRQVDEASRQLDAIRGRIRRADPRFAELAQPVPVTLAEIRARAIAADTLALEYWLGDTRSYVWFIGNNSLRSVELPPRAEIDTLADQLREALTQPAHPNAAQSFEQQAAGEVASATVVRALGARLGALLALPSIAAGAQQRYIVVADGALQRLPFTLLVADAAAARDYSYLPSLQTLRWLRAGKARRPTALAVFADPVLGADDPRLAGVNAAASSTLGAGTQNALPRLPYAHDEAQTLAALLPAGVGAQRPYVALGFDASRDAALQLDWSRYTLVHFATHALLDLRHPELSGVVLSLYDAAGRPRDGFLRINDLYRLNMPAELVVLSACESALGRSDGAEGVFNLARAFFYAGARRVLSSLWTVDDRASAEFMKQFYRALLQRQRPPDAALREAQAALAADPRWQAPYYWAGYVLQGQ